MTMNIDYAGRAGAALYTDLVMMDGVLIGTTRYGGAIDSWTSDLSQIDSLTHTRGDTAGGEAELTVVNFSDGPALMTGGGAAGSLQLITVTDGALSTAIDYGAFSWPADITASAAVTLTNGRIGFYGGFWGEDGIARLQFAGNGALLGTGYTPDTTQSYAAGITAMTTASFGATQYIATLAQEMNGLTLWSVADNGNLWAEDTVDAADGLWISAPTAIETVVIGANTYMIVAAAGSGSLSVVTLDATGAMSVIDHLIDDLDTRFAGVIALATIQVDGETWVAAGGADDGVSVFALLPNGMLEPVAHMADTVTAGLADVSTIELGNTDGIIDIYVGSASETGITHLTFNPNGATISGTNSAETLWGTAGDDLILDGGGVDILTGGAGEDVFIFTPDTITDFTLGEDRIDISSWGLIRNLSQIGYAETDDGLTLTYGEDTLHIQSSNPLTWDQLVLHDLVPISRYSNLTMIDENNDALDPSLYDVLWRFCGTADIPDDVLKQMVNGDFDAGF
jgi:serralysin